jgi:hypothetical protein
MLLQEQYEGIDLVSAQSYMTIVLTCEECTTDPPASSCFWLRVRNTSSKLEELNIDIS